MLPVSGPQGTGGIRGKGAEGARLHLSLPRSGCRLLRACLFKPEPKGNQEDLGSPWRHAPLHGPRTRTTLNHGGRNRVACSMADDGYWRTTLGNTQGAIVMVRFVPDFSLGMQQLRLTFVSFQKAQLGLRSRSSRATKRCWQGSSRQRSCLARRVNCRFRRPRSKPRRPGLWFLSFFPLR